MCLRCRHHLPVLESCVMGCAVFTACGAVRHSADLRGGERVAVVATGGVGLNIVQIARAFGASQIIAIDVRDDKLEIARRLGATDVINSRTTNSTEHVKEITDGRGVGVAFEVLGRPETFVDPPARCSRRVPARSDGDAAISPDRSRCSVPGTQITATSSAAPSSSREHHMRYTSILILFTVVSVAGMRIDHRVAGAHSATQGSSSGGPLTSADLNAVAALPGEPRSVSAAGVTRSGARLLTVENGGPFAGTSQKRLVIVADDERAARAVLGGIRWFKTAAPRALREGWAVSAVLLSVANDAAPAQKLEFPPVKGFFDHPEQPESRYLWRWVAYQAPDLLLQVRGGDVLSIGTPPSGSLAAAMAGGSELGTVAAVFATARDTDGVAVIQHALQKTGIARPSEIRATLAARVARDPLDIARVLAHRYPQNAIVSYIPSVAWANTLRLAEATKDDSLKAKVLEQVRPWLSRERPLFGERIALTAAAGTLIYAELAARGEQAARDLAVQGAEAARKLRPNGLAEHGGGWTDDMFMASAILSRTGRMPGREHDLEHIANFLVSYAGRLQRPDGIFVHFTDGSVPWGRGNGFAALGLTEALTALPPSHPSRTRVLEIYRRHMSALRGAQAPDGMWRQVIDEPGAYREESSTAMILTAMARGVRLGWLDANTYGPVIDRAWPALAAHITEDGGVVDISTSTGSGPNLRFYLDRTAISGFDDRGGAMGLLASMEMHEFRGAPPQR